MSRTHRVRLVLATLVLALLVPSTGLSAEKQLSAPAKVEYCSPWNISCQTHARSNWGGWMPLYHCWGPSCTAVKAWIPSPTRVKMLCWADGRWATGNYGSNRWFQVHDYHHGLISFIHSSYVVNQVSVGRC